MATLGRPEELMAKAAEARRQGRAEEARRLLQAVVQQQPGHAAAHNSLGIIALGERDSRSAAEHFARAAEADPGAPPVWINLAEAYRMLGDPAQELTSLDRALALDPYLLPALLKKAQALERLGRLDESAAVYSGLFAASPDDSAAPEAYRAAIAHGRKVVRTQSEARAAELTRRAAEVRAAHPEADLRRALAYAENLAGRRKVYQHQPTAGHFPYLPAIEFFDRESFPWLETLEQAAGEIRRDLLSLWTEGHEGFRPYVAFDPSQPVNQWEELNNSPRWSAWFFWKDGVRQEANCARCSATTAVLDSLPLLDIPGKAPTVMFSILEPRTRIPPHTGSSNVRVTIHLPLVVPGGCAFRVGAETRPWREGEAWAFDDTIEHEAWNDSDKPRAILILDAWNPFLSDAERDVVRAIG